MQKPICKEVFSFLFFTVFMHCFSLSVVGQRDLSINASFGGRDNFGYTFNQQGNILINGGPENYYSDGAYTLNLNYRFNRYFALEGGIEYSQFGLGLTDQKFRSTFNIKSDFHDIKADKDGFMGGFQYYYDIHSSFYTYVPLLRSYDFYWYTALGFHWNNRLTGATFNDEYTQNNETLRLYSTFGNSFGGTRIQTGILINVGRCYLYGGPTFNIPITSGPVITSDYTVTQNNTTLYTDHASSSGYNWGMEFRLGFVIWRENKNKAHKNTSDHKKFARYRKHVKQIADEAKRDSIISKIEGREVDVSHHITAKKKRITIKLSDNVTEDGDVVSLNLNGKWIIENYTLTTNEKVIHVKLHPGKNYLSLHAVQLGQYPPCTLSITIEDGTSRHKITLNSTLESSDTVEIILK